jgi:hypothetical protein
VRGSFRVVLVTVWNFQISLDNISIVACNAVFMLFNSETLFAFDSSILNCFFFHLEEIYQTVYKMIDKLKIEKKRKKWKRYICAFDFCFQLSLICWSSERAISTPLFFVLLSQQHISCVISFFNFIDCSHLSTHV